MTYASWQFTRKLVLTILSALLGASTQEKSTSTGPSIITGVFRDANLSGLYFNPPALAVLLQLMVSFSANPVKQLALK
jgi:hypothetical protein